MKKKSKKMFARFDGKKVSLRDEKKNFLPIEILGRSCVKFAGVWLRVRVARMFKTRRTKNSDESKESERKGEQKRDKNKFGNVTHLSENVQRSAEVNCTKMQIKDE